MAAQVSLLAYLQRALPEIQIADDSERGPNTRSPHYNFQNISSVNRWESFNLARIRERFGDVLSDCMIRDDTVTLSRPDSPANAEVTIQSRIERYLTKRVDRALRYAVGFLELQLNQDSDEEDSEDLRYTLLHHDIGAKAAHTRNSLPDYAFYDPTIDRTSRPNRAPGDIKPSWKWSSDLRTNTRRSGRNEFKQVLSQVNFYMKESHTRYGYIITDQELVAIRRLDRDGNLQISDPIPWSAHGTANHPQMTVALGLWYLGMLASDEETWRLN